MEKIDSLCTTLNEKPDSTLDKTKDLERSNKPFCEQIKHLEIVNLDLQRGARR